MTRRPVHELVQVDSPAWPGVLEATAAAPMDVVLLPIERAAAEAALYRLQVTAASVLGAIVLNSGGILVDRGWLRILGGGSVGLPDVATASPMPDGDGPPDHVVVGYDVLGGTFAINGGGLEGVPAGEVAYWGPDILDWTALGGGHTAFVHWALSRATTGFYESLRWSGWEAEVAALGVDQGLAVHPPPCTREGANISAVSRRPVPFVELLEYNRELAAQLNALPEGQQFRVVFGE